MEIPSFEVIAQVKGRKPYTNRLSTRMVNSTYYYAKQVRAKTRQMKATMKTLAVEAEKNESFINRKFWRSALFGCLVMILISKILYSVAWAFFPDHQANQLWCLTGVLNSATKQSEDVDQGAMEGKIAVNCPDIQINPVSNVSFSSKETKGLIRQSKLTLNRSSICFS